MAAQSRAPAPSPSDTHPTMTTALMQAKQAAANRIAA